jgi:hypothetical protein
LFRKRMPPTVSSSLRQRILFFKKLKIFGYDGVSLCLYFLNSSYSDPVFTAGEDTEDPWVNMKLYISNTFDSLCVRLVLDVLSGKASLDYVSDMKVDEVFETVVHELRTYFGFCTHSVNLITPILPFDIYPE